MRSVVIDASVTLAWCFPDEKSAYADKVLEELEGQVALVPSVWALEIANGLLVGERRKRISQVEILRFMDLLEAFPVQEVSLPVSAHIAGVLPLGREYGLSAYDASYLDAAIRNGAELATADDALEKAARKAGIPIMCAPHPRKAKR
ncbi:MAG: type II toxin-antitoxin system VapC family toxin [Proteobacteria bacterium]|nr:type II toxin-antitoxin system VapC family toxin [Pseudomonadota bacterium]